MPGGIGRALKVFSGSASNSLVNEICPLLDMEPGKVDIQEFANENLFVKIQENVRECDVFVVQTSCSPVNTHLMELLLMIDALKHASACRITAVLPYFPYVRSDKKDQPRISIAARLVADLLDAAGADRILTMNLHSFQIQGFFRVPADHLVATPILVDYWRQQNLSDCVVVAPDAGSAKRADKFARLLELPLAIMDKRRSTNDDTSIVKHIIGDVKGKRAIIMDDEISTGGSLINTVQALEEHGTVEISAGAVHAVLVGPAIEQIQNSSLKEVVVTNTIPVEGEKKIKKIKVLSVARMFAKAIRRIHNGESVSVLFSPFEEL
ncbi:MAG: ribose-phosphate pyrophosphokinase [bacterium]